MTLNARIIQFLGGPHKLNIKKKNAQDYNYMDIVTLERQGLPYLVIEVLEKKYGIGHEDLGRLLHISTKTIERKLAAKKGLEGGESSNATRLAKVYERANQVLGNDENVRAWLKSAQVGLGNIIPLDLLDSDKGTEEILNLLNRIEFGILG
jgi:putative toxin-antitoxin system antitoxin component (TIGR02293 family)